MELRQWLEEGIRTLPADQRATLVLRDVQGYSYKENALARVGNASIQ
jgi:DNA-directed RNA polymerase specialized sigma24 family protein